MADQKLVDYLKKQYDKGFGPETLRPMLLKKGWKEEDVDSAIKEVETPNEAETEAPQPAESIQQPVIEKKQPPVESKAPAAPKPVSSATVPVRAPATPVLAAKKEIIQGEYAGFWYRVSAAVWDGVIFSVPYFILALFLGSASMDIYSPSVWIVNLAITLVVIMMDANGGTPGKRLLGLMIVNEEKTFIGIPHSILRYVGKIVSGIILGIGFLMIGFDKNKQGLHDRIAKTYVVKSGKTGFNKMMFIGGFVITILLPIALTVFLIIFSLSALTSQLSTISQVQLTPSKCEMPSGIICLESNLWTNGTSKMVIMNGLPYTLDSVAMSLGSMCTPAGASIAIGAKREFYCPVPLAQVSQKYDHEVSFDYVEKETGTIHKEKGSLSASYSG